MSNKISEARSVLDCFLFEDIINNTNHSEDEWDITYEGDNYVLRCRETGELFHFQVSIMEHAWDSAQARRDQEWDEEDWFE